MRELAVDRGHDLHHRLTRRRPDVDLIRRVEVKLEHKLIVVDARRALYPLDVRVLERPILAAAADLDPALFGVDHQVARRPHHLIVLLVTQVRRLDLDVELDQHSRCGGGRRLSRRPSRVLTRVRRRRRRPCRRRRRPWPCRRRPWPCRRRPFAATMCCIVLSTSYDTLE